jgi:acyl-CoA synthetase (AMP-forming)/AMP-acid ligase II
MGYIDKTLNIHIVGQRSFMIRNFHNEIYPNELEDLIQRISGVQYSCVIGLPDTVEIEVPAVFIVKVENANVTEDDIKACTFHLPPYKHIRDVFFVPSLPMTPSGKVQRRVVKEMADEMKILIMSKRLRTE